LAELKTIVEKKERLGVVPYEDLYIYVLNGSVRKDEETFFGSESPAWSSNSHSEKVSKPHCMSVGISLCLY